VGVTAKSSIFRGTQSDIGAFASNQCPSATATVDLYNSNYRGSKVEGSQVNDKGGNQLTQDPLFVNAAGGDFHEASGSPTIDAGVADAISGAFDSDGHARTRPLTSGPSSSCRPVRRAGAAVRAAARLAVAARPGPGAPTPSPGSGS
jgi:hypothetical protein